MTSIILGCDPGQKGAIAALTPAGDFVDVFDLPYISNGKLSWCDGSALQSWLLQTLQGSDAKAYVERVSSMPGQGISSSFNFGAGLGSLLATLQTRFIPIHLVTPAKWKADCHLTPNKNASLHSARLRWPTAPLTLQKHEGRAEALLLCHWGIQHGTL